MLCCCGMSQNSMPFLQLTVTISVLRLLLPDSEVTAKTDNGSVHAVHAIHVCMRKHEQPTNQISLKNRPRCYTKSPTAQDVFRPLPRLISYAGVTRRWGLLSHAQNDVATCKSIGRSRGMHLYRIASGSILNPKRRLRISGGWQEKEECLLSIKLRKACPPTASTL